MKRSGTSTGLSKKQREVAEMLANPDVSANKTEIIEQVGVPRTTLYRWLKDPDFIKYVDSLIDSYTDAELSTVWKALIRRCICGDTQAIKLYFELKGKYKQQIELSGTDDFVFNILPASERE